MLEIGKKYSSAIMSTIVSISEFIKKLCKTKTALKSKVRNKLRS